MGENHQQLKPQFWREKFRAGETINTTAALCPGYLQANLTVLPAILAGAFESFCQQNPKACPVLEKLPTGSWSPSVMTHNADLRYDLPRYRVYLPSNEQRWIEERSVEAYWQKDAVAFLTGCSFSFDALLAQAGLVPRHVEMGCNVPMFKTQLSTTPAGDFSSPLVVSMRPVSNTKIQFVSELTRQYPQAHGEPLTIQSLQNLGIKNIHKPDWGDPVEIKANETPLFWPCGVTTQLAVQSALQKHPDHWAITHSPGCMFLCDKKITL
ncbi:D-glutamate cyclase family protein [Parendozoicomonas haliclonae]|uniref:Hydro-lyase n=1 Tax=Parendozoicomonas haliclonae TaxID=1960125 RepID=A0A1X7AG49_9GAMM|nr:DUF1445 domain-containing protein [Parendozoicomonas haliclonae]SMA39063.1 hypothetical protein EHSB41UT_00964 [Parendozoicomonas haliclonae]